MRDAVKAELQYECSAGISANKALAKLASAKYKPNQQTILLDSGIREFLRPLEVRKLRGWGGDFGAAVVDRLGVRTVEDLWAIKEEEITRCFPSDAAHFVLLSAYGHYAAEVRNRTAPKSLGTNKQVKPTTNIMPWVKVLCHELATRHEEFEEIYKQRMKSLTFGLQYDSGGGSYRKTTAMPRPCTPEKVLAAVEGMFPSKIPPSTFISISGHTVVDVVDEEKLKKGTLFNFFPSKRGHTDDTSDQLNERDHAVKRLKGNQPAEVPAFVDVDDDDDVGSLNLIDEDEVDLFPESSDFALFNNQSSSGGNGDEVIVIDD
eukprot:PhM_4_TR9153/c0_g1_i1/m.38619/K03509/POLH; DNA polymerase eta